MKILIIQTAFIGDVVLATPIIEKLKSNYPDATIDFLLRKGNENLLKNHPKLNQVLIWDKKNGKFKNLFKIVKKLRRERYDYVFNLQRFGSTGLMTWLSKAKNKIGFKKNPFSFSYTVKILHQIGNGTHEVERNLKLLESVTDTEFVQPKLYPPSEAFKKVEKYQAKPYIVIAPTSVWFTKQFPEDKWIDFLQDLNFQGNIYLIGGPGDKEACMRIIEGSGKGVNLCGELSLIESVALIKEAQMNYVNDSAPMHFASSVNAPTCAIFCSTIPDFGFGPLSEKATITQVVEDLPCRPCGLHGKKACPEGHFNCANRVDHKKMIQLLES